MKNKRGRDAGTEKLLGLWVFVAPVHISGERQARQRTVPGVKI